MRHLRAVAAIAAEGSVLGASKALRVTQPALSRTLGDIEAILGRRLFLRSARGVEPTAAGAHVAATARAVLAEIARLDAALGALAAEAARDVSLGAMPVAAVGLLPAVLARTAARHPRLRVRLVQGRTEELIPPLLAGDLDLVVGRLYPPPEPDGLVRTALYEEPISVLARAGHPILRLAEPSAADLAAYKLVLPTLSQRVGQEVERILATLNLAVSVSLRSTSAGFTRELLHASDSLTICPRVMLAGDLMRGTMRIVPLPVPGPARPAGVIRRAGGPPHPGVDDLIGCLHDTLAEFAAAGLVNYADPA